MQIWGRVLIGRGNKVNRSFEVDVFMGYLLKSKKIRVIGVE